MTTLLDHAIIIAVQAHAGQFRKDKRTPYIVHPVAVVRILAGNLDVTDEEVLAAGALHDTVEDTHITAAYLEEQFGKRVTELVSWVTNPEDLLHRSGQFMQAKQAHILKIIREAPMDAVRIKLADRMDNVRDASGPIPSGVWSIEKRQQFFAQSVEIFRAIRDRALQEKAGLIEQVAAAEAAVTAMACGWR